VQGYYIYFVETLDALSRHTGIEDFLMNTSVWQAKI